MLGGMNVAYLLHLLVAHGHGRLEQMKHLLRGIKLKLLPWLRVTWTLAQTMRIRMIIPSCEKQVLRSWRLQLPMNNVDMIRVPPGEDLMSTVQTEQIVPQHPTSLARIDACQRSSGSFTEQHQRIRSSTKSWYGWSFS